MRTRLLVPLLLLLSASTVRAEEPSFGRHVTPILYKLGCSAGACHGSFSGKGGFRLSLFAGSPETDYRNLRGVLGRRIDAEHPEQSLLLAKPTMSVPHAGGLRLVRESKEYEVLLRWIAAGARYEPDRELKVQAVRIEPASFTLPAGKGTVPLKVLAKLADGREEDVTALARFEALDPSVAQAVAHASGSVMATATVTGKRAADVAILAHYAGQVGFSTVLVPGELPSGITFPTEKLTDKVDQLLVERLHKLNIVPSGPADDVEFLRRAYLDVTGVLPLPQEIRAFLDDKTPNKREKLIDRLLENPLHSALWAGKLCDMVGADDRFIAQRVYDFHDWFRNKLESNTPWDQLAYGVICATAADDRSAAEIQADQKRDEEARKAAKDKKPIPDGKKPWQIGYGTRKTLEIFYSNLIHTQDAKHKRIVDSRKIALRVAHTFLGVRLECAQCHKHPNDRWSQADFFGFSTVFAHVDFGLDPSLKAQKVNLSGTHPTTMPVEEFVDPETLRPVAARLLGGSDIAVKEGIDPRKDLWQWLVRKDNPYFAQAIVNRVWEHYLGRGFIEPADAQSAANPPSHPEVLDELVRDFIDSKYDLRRLHRRVLNTAAYARSWQTNATNAQDERNFSHRLLRRLTAEQALDALAQVTGMPLKIPKRYATPREGERAVEIALSRVGGDDGYVLQIFGRPIRVQNCDCERSAAASLSQTLYLYNDEKLIAKIQDEKGRLARLLNDMRDDTKLVEELYLLTLSRPPTPQEIVRSLAHVRSAASRQEGFQDIVWSLLNRQDFIVNH